MEPQIRSFLCFNPVSALSGGESCLDHFRLSPFPKGAVLAKDLSQFCTEGPRFHVKLSTECFVHFQHKFGKNYSKINILDE